jgi:hypothetical protein
MIQPLVEYGTFWFALSGSLSGFDVRVLADKTALALNRMRVVVCPRTGRRIAQTSRYIKNSGKKYTRALSNIDTRAAMQCGVLGWETRIV